MDLKVGDLAHWTLVTNDLARSRRFYTEVLCAQPVNRDWPPCVVLGNTTIDLFEATSEAGHPMIPSPLAGEG